MSQPSQDNPQQLAAQLRQPTGDYGLKLSVAMNESNAGINRFALSLLDLKAEDTLLEIGPGNGGFVPELLQGHARLQYTGLDWSQDMVEAAREYNQLHKQQCRFIQGSSHKMPFDSGSFDWVFTVNTLYFWEKPEQDFAEIKRVLKSKGQLCLAFADASFMAGLDFAQYNFKHYDKTQVSALLAQAGFRVSRAEVFTETALSNSVQSVEKYFHVLICVA